MATGRSTVRNSSDGQRRSFCMRWIILLGSSSDKEKECRVMDFNDREIGSLDEALDDVIDIILDSLEEEE